MDVPQFGCQQSCRMRNMPWALPPRTAASDGEFCVRFNAGVASISPAAKTADLAITADNALYQVKRPGRNRVVLAGQ